MRSCGNCTLCCTLTRVPEFEKPVNVTCVWCTKGCSIYEARPQSCRDFKCEWLKGYMPGWMRPDKVHVMIEALPDVPVVIALPERGHEKTWRTDKVVNLLRSYYQAEGTAVVASDRTALIPKGMTEQSVINNVMKAARDLGVALT